MDGRGTPILKIDSLDSLSEGTETVYRNPQATLFASRPVGCPPDPHIDNEDREQHRLHIITTQSREADEKGSYSGSGDDRTMTGTYTETISSSEEFKEAQLQHHWPTIHDGGLEYIYENVESDYHSTSKLRMNNQSTQIYEGTYGPEGQTRELTVDTKTIKEGLLFTSTDETYERLRGRDSKETYESTWDYTNVVPNEGTPHGEETTYVVRTTTDYNMYFTLDIIVTGPDNKPIIGPDGAFTYDRLTDPHIEGLTYYDDLYDENASLVAKRPVVTLQAAIEAGMIQPANDDSWWWAGTKGAGWGLLQGSANALNGIQDAGIGLLNLGVDAVIPSIPLLGPIIDIPDIPSPDWSRDLVTHEGGEPGSWSDTHGWSKFLGGEGVIALGTGGVSEVRHLRHVRKLKNLDTASDSARLANAAQQTSNTRTVASQLDNLLDDTARQADNGLANAADDFAKPVTVEVNAPRRITSTYGKYVRRVDDFKHALDPNHVIAAAKEKAGEVLKLRPDGIPYDHLTETRNAMQGAKRHINNLKKHLSDPKLSSADRAIIEGELGELSKILDGAEGILGELAK